MFTSTLIYFFPHSASYFFNQNQIQMEQLSKYMDEICLAILVSFVLHIFIRLLIHLCVPMHL